MSLSNWVKVRGILQNILNKEEWDKMHQFYSSMPILMGTDHPEKFTLDDIIGRTDNWERGKDDKWYGDLNFDLDRLPEQFKTSLTVGRHIPASTQLWVKEADGHQGAVPVHLLMHPDLVPRFPDAGTLNNNVVSSYVEIINNQEETPMEDVKELKKQLSELEKSHTSKDKEIEALKKSNADYEVSVKTALIKSILSVNNTYKEAELTSKSKADLELIKDTLARAPVNKTGEPIPLGNAGGSGTQFWSQYDKNQAAGVYK